MPHKNQEYMLLHEVLPGERGRALLGSVIYAKHHTRPDDNFVPDREDLSKPDQDQIVNLFSKVWDNPKSHVTLENLIRDKSDTLSGSASIGISNLFNSWISGKRGQRYKITAGITSRYTIPNVGRRLENSYMKCDPWWDQVTSFYDKADHDHRIILYLISGVWLCKNMVTHAEVNNEVGGGGGLNVAAGQQPVPIEAKGEMKGGHQEVLGETINDEVVFAIRCHRLELDEEVVTPVDSSWWSWLSFFGKKPRPLKKLVGVRLGLPVPGNISAVAGGQRKAAAAKDSHPDLEYFYLSEPAFASIEDVEETMLAEEPNGYVA